MVDLSTKIGTLSLKNPIIAASSPLTGNIDSLIKLEEAGVGAVVLKSIFEEELKAEAQQDLLENEEYLAHSDASVKFSSYSIHYRFGEYLQLIKEAKAKLNIPVIASVNCLHISTFLEYVKAIEAVGPDAIELNYYTIATNSKVKGKEVEEELFDFVKRARKATTLPLLLKIGHSYSSLSNVLKRLDEEKVDGIVMFNRFYHPDIDIEKEELTASYPLSSEHEASQTLRWIALSSAEMKNCALIANTGIYSGESVIKMLLSGAKAVEICSVLMQNGVATCKTMLEELNAWMERKGYASLSDFTGKLAQENLEHPELWERTQFFKTITKGR